MLAVTYLISTQPRISSFLPHLTCVLHMDPRTDSWPINSSIKTLAHMHFRPDSWLLWYFTCLTRWRNRVFILADLRLVGDRFWRFSLKIFIANFWRTALHIAHELLVLIRWSSWFLVFNFHLLSAIDINILLININFDLIRQNGGSKFSRLFQYALWRFICEFAAPRWSRVLIIERSYCLAVWYRSLHIWLTTGERLA